MQIKASGNCGGTYDEGLSVITTPNYPNTYPLREKCNWNIEVPIGQYIELQFEHFNLGPDNTCRFEWLQIHDGENQFYPTLTKKLCGNSKPSIIVSGRNRTFLRWQSDYSRSFSGFKISLSIPGK